MRINRTVAITLVIIILGCAQVPKESVELSTTVGRDIAEVYRAHRELAVILYKRIKEDINEFVDEVYGPFQIRQLLQGEQNDLQEIKKFFQANQNNFPKIKKFLLGEQIDIQEIINDLPESNEMRDKLDTSLLLALEIAINQPDNSKAQNDALNSMDIFVQVLRAEIESYRKQLLDPVVKQEEQLLSAINQSYNQIHYANSIITGHLASIVKVHDAQEEVLKKRFGVEGLREKIGVNLAKVSDEVANIVNKAKKAEVQILETEKKVKEQKDKLQENIDKFKSKFDDIFEKKSEE